MALISKHPVAIEISETLSQQKKSFLVLKQKTPHENQSASTDIVCWRFSQLEQQV